MRKIVTLMLALGGLSFGCGEDPTDEDLSSEPQAQVLDAGRVAPSSDAGVVDAGPSYDAGKRGKRASAKIEARSGNTTLAGTIVFEELDDTVIVSLKLTGAPPGPHGVHLHAKGDCSAADATSAGDHWNPTSGVHGAPSDATHLGDLGNLIVGADGTASTALANTHWAIGDGSPNDVIGKAIVVHGGPDDLTTQPSGNSGPRIGCGVIAAN
ncbi:MAG: superoxide dismutase family protein [Polyangiales bacterium]